MILHWKFSQPRLDNWYWERQRKCFRVAKCGIPKLRKECLFYGEDKPGRIFGRKCLYFKIRETSWTDLSLISYYGILRKFYEQFKMIFRFIEPLTNTIFWIVVPRIVVDGYQCSGTMWNFIWGFVVKIFVHKRYSSIYFCFMTFMLINKYKNVLYMHVVSHWEWFPVLVRSPFDKTSERNWPCSCESFGLFPGLTWNINLPWK